MQNNNSKEKIRQNAQAAGETAELQKVAEDIITSTTKSITGYVNKVVNGELLSVQDSTIKDLIVNAISEYDAKLKKEKTD